MLNKEDPLDLDLDLRPHPSLLDDASESTRALRPLRPKLTKRSSDELELRVRVRGGVAVSPVLSVVAAVASTATVELRPASI